MTLSVRENSATYLSTKKQQANVLELIYLRYVEAEAVEAV